MCTLSRSFLFFAAAMAGLAQFGPRAAIRTFGQLERDGSALYSVYVASGPEEIGNLNIAVALPAGSRFLELVHKPAAAEYEGVQKDAVYWAVPKLEGDTLLGPFVFRVRPDGSGELFPETLFGVLAIQTPGTETFSTQAPSGRLRANADLGVLTVGPAGTRMADGTPGPVAVGETGVFLSIPEGAVDRDVKITVRQIPFASLQLPATDPPTWWCSTFDVRSEPQVTFAKPIQFALPTRRPVTPGLEVSSIGSETVPVKEGIRGIGFGAGNVTCTTFQFGIVRCTSGTGFGFGGFGAFGYVEQDNLRSSRPGSQLTAQGATGATGFLAAPPSIVRAFAP